MQPKLFGVVLLAQKKYQLPMRKKEIIEFLTQLRGGYPGVSPVRFMRIAKAAAPDRCRYTNGTFTLQFEECLDAYIDDLCSLLEWNHTVK